MIGLCAHGVDVTQPCAICHAHVAADRAERRATRLAHLLREAAPWLLADPKMNPGYGAKVLDLHGRIMRALAEDGESAS